MRIEEQANPEPRQGLYALLSLLTVVTLVEAQPVYQMLASNQEFLLARRVGRAELLTIVAVFNLLPPLVVWAVWGALRRIHRGVARSFLGGAFFLLTLPLFFEIHNRYIDPRGEFGEVYLLWLIPAGLVGFASLRHWKEFRVCLLAILPIVFLLPGIFLTRTWLVLPKGEPATGQRAPAATAKKSSPPIFLFVFDEFSLPILLDESGGIDAEHFPRFRALAEASYWMRNATANASETRQAIPAILTGTYPVKDDASAAAYPNNLFSWLYPQYEIHAYEYGTNFCVPERFHCPVVEAGGLVDPLLLDVFYLYAARVKPASVELNLPDPTITWGPFRSLEEEMRARIRSFQEFLASLDRAPSRNSLYYFHSMLPHAPYALTPGGRLYETTYMQASILPKAIRGNRPVLESLRRRYRMQVGYVDKLVGQFVDRLQELDLYDKSIIVITGDHGISWKPEAPGRPLKTSADPRLVLSVPLFLKVPFQQKGGRVLRDVQHIDLVPTLADLLGQPLPWPTDGRSVFAPPIPDRKKVAYERGHRYEFPATLGLEGGPAVIEIAEEAPDSPWIGKPVDSFTVVEYEAEGFYFEPVNFSPVWELGLAEDYVVYVTGLIDPSKTAVPDQIAVALNGKIVAVVPPRGRNPEGKPLVWTSFSGHRLQDGENVIKIYVVVDAEQEKLGHLNRFTQHLTPPTLAQKH